MNKLHSFTITCKMTIVAGVFLALGHYQGVAQVMAGNSQTDNNNPINYKVASVIATADTNPGLNLPQNLGTSHGNGSSLPRIPKSFINKYLN